MFVRAIIFSKVGDSGKVVHEGLAGKWISPMHPEIIRDEPGQCDVCGMDLVPAESLGMVNDGVAGAALVVPVSAPLITGERAVVYLKDPQREGVFMGREIVLGPRAGDKYIVKSGLSEGDIVVTNGNFKIDSELQIRGKYSMMYHESSTSGEDDALLERFEVPATFHDSLEPAWGGYFAVQKALSEDNLESARFGAERVKEGLGKVVSGNLSARVESAWNGLAGDLLQHVTQLTGAGSLEQARTGFEALSVNMTRIAQQFGVGSQEVYRFHCPMAFDNKGADWLQNNSSLANPYFGAMMYRCGSQVEVLGSDSRAEQSHDGEDEGMDHGHDHDADHSPDHSEETPEGLQASPAFHQSIQPLWAAYFAMQKAASEDDPTTAGTAARGIAAALPRAAAGELNASALGRWNTISDKLARAATAASSSDLDGLRAHFETISLQMLELAEALGTGDQTIYRFHCPMAFDDKGADWLQDNDSLANPYFGSMMYGCGSLVGALGKQ